MGGDNADRAKPIDTYLPRSLALLDRKYQRVGDIQLGRIELDMTIQTDTKAHCKIF